MMLNKELLQGELPADASSTVSVIINISILYPCHVVGSAENIRGTKKEGERNDSKRGIFHHIV